jgi:hypothetical protein
LVKEGWQPLRLTRVVRIPQLNKKRAAQSQDRVAL